MKHLLFRGSGSVGFERTTDGLLHCAWWDRALLYHPTPLLVPPPAHVFIDWKVVKLTLVFPPLLELPPYCCMLIPDPSVSQITDDLEPSYSSLGLNPTERLSDRSTQHVTLGGSDFQIPNYDPEVLFCRESCML